MHLQQQTSDVTVAATITHTAVVPAIAVFSNTTSLKLINDRARIDNPFNCET